MNLDEYRVTGGQVKLSDWPTKTDGGWKRDDAEARAEKLQARMSDLQERLYAEGRQSLLVVLQARDAGGKDGTIKHVFGGMNPQGVVVTGFKAPTPEELAHDFLWRVHPHAPRAGNIALFNRSHYEDVLVPRVHALLDARSLKRRLKHIRAFEDLLEDRGTRVVKLYLHISKEEQRERLQDRLDEPDKHWKFNPADLAERALWDDYSAAYEDVIAHSATAAAPWYLVPADRKWFRNLLVSEIIVGALEEMNPQTPPPDYDPKEIDLE